MTGSAEATLSDRQPVFFLILKNATYTLPSSGSARGTYAPAIYEEGSMKQNMTRLCLCLLSMVMLLSLFSCGQTQEPDVSESATLSATEADTADEAAEALAALGELDWGGEDFTFLYVDDLGGYPEEVVGEPLSDSSSAGLLSNAVYERNTLFEERCNLKFRTVGKSGSAVQSSIQAEVSAGSSSYQLVSYCLELTANLCTTGILYNYLDYDIDYEKPWWDAGTLSFNLNGNVFFMSGAHNTVDNDVTYLMAYNKKLAEAYRIEGLYTTVQNGEWTLEYFENVLRGLSTDNGDGKWDQQDMYGLASAYTLANSLFYGAELRYVVTDPESGNPVLAMDDGKLEKAVNVLNATRRIYHENNTAYIGTTETFMHAAEIFADGRAVFFCHDASRFSLFNARMEEDYGVLPTPKYDKQQERYYTWAHGVGSTICIPETSGGAEGLGKIMEAYVILSHQTVSPVYYDVLLKSRSVRDPESVEILEDLFSNRVYDLPMYFTQFGFYEIATVVADTNQDSFISRYQSAAKRFDRTLSTILKKLETK